MNDIKVYELHFESAWRTTDNDTKTSKFFRYVAAHDYESAVEYARNTTPPTELLSIKKLGYLRHWKGSNVSKCVQAEY